METRSILSSISPCAQGSQAFNQGNTSGRYRKNGGKPTGIRIRDTRPRMVERREWWLALLFLCLGLLISGAPAFSQGINQVTWNAPEVGHEVFNFSNSVVGAQPTMADFQRGYLYIGAAGAVNGSTAGRVNWYSITNPRAPRLIQQVTASGNKPHMAGFFKDKMIDGYQANFFRIWNYDARSVANTYNGSVSPVYYFCQPPYVFRPRNGYGTGANLMEIADITSGNGSQLALFDLGTAVPFAVGALHAIGNLLICSASQAKGVAVFDISDPGNPRLLSSLVTGNPVYTSQVHGSRVYQCESGVGIRIYDFSDPSNIREVGFISFTGFNPRYVALKDNRGYCAPGAAKITVFNATNFTVITNWAMPGPMDFVNLVGNMAVTGGNEGAERCSIIPIQQGPDTTGPLVQFASPTNSARNLALTSRIGFVMSDQIDVTSLTTNTFLVRPTGGSALPGTYSTQMGVINFSPDAPLEPNTTYDVILPAGGVKDVVGNGLAQAFSMTFTTGDVFDEDALAHWRFNNSAADSSGNGHTLTLVNGPAYVADAQEGANALQFDGANDYADAGAFDVGANFTIAGWVKIASGRTNIQTIIANAPGGSTTAGFKLFVNSYQTTDGKLILETGNGTIGSSIATGTGMVLNNVWTHIAVTVNRAAGTAHLFVNGNDQTAGGVVQTDFPTTNVINLARMTGNQLLLGGLLDDVKIYPVELSANQIKSLAMPGLIARWPFNNSVADVSGFNHLATLANGADYSTLHVEGTHSLVLDGVNDNANGGTVPLGDQFSVSLWARIPAAATNIQTLLANSLGGANADGFRWFVNSWNSSDRRLVLETGNGITGISMASGTGIFALDQWNHLALLVNRATGTATVYYNGTLAATGTTRTDFSTNSAIIMGAMGSAGFPLLGNLDDIRIYSRLLSTNEIGVLATHANTAPQIQTLSASTNTPLVNQAVTLATTASDADADTLLYSYNFGDGSASTAFSTNRTAQHTYTAPGRFTVLVQVNDGNTTANKSMVVIVHYAQTSPVPSGSSQIVYDASRNKVWCVNPDSDTVSRIDGTTLAKDLEIPVGTKPKSIALKPNNTALWIACEKSGEIWVLSATNGTMLSKFVLPRGIAPVAVAFSPNGSLGFIAAQGTNAIFKLNPTNLTILGTRVLGAPPSSVAVSGDSTRALVSRFISPDNQGEVWDVNTSTMALTRTLTLAFDNTPDSQNAGRGVPNYLIQVAITPDGRQAWIPSKKDNIARGTFRDGLPLTHDSTVRSIISQIDLVANAENFAAREDVDNHSLPGAICFSPLGDIAFVAFQGNNEVRAIDTATGNSLSAVDTGLAPQGVCVTPDGSKLFVMNFMSRSVAAFNISQLTSGASSQMTRLGETNVVAVEKLSAQVLTGKRIFYNAADPRMAGEGYITCVSCHLDGGHDGRTWDFTDRGEGLRNTITMHGRRGMGHGRVHWSGNFDEIQDFELDIRNAFGGSGFIASGTPNPPLGAANAGRSPELDALAAYVSSLNTFARSPYRTGDGSLTLAGASGRKLFMQRNCTACHSGADFTDSAANLLHDVGTIKASSGQRLGGPLTGLDTPSLKGLWNTAPYLHDGSAATLLDVLTTANTNNQHGVLNTLTTAQKNDLVSYLQQIDDLEIGGITHLWSMETNAVDSIGTNDGINNGATFVAGKAGNAGLFDGADYINLGAVNLGNTFSVAAWVWVDTNAGNIQTILCNSTGGYNAQGFRFYVNSFNTTNRLVVLETGDGTNGNAAATGPNAVTLGAWNHLALTVDRAAGIANIYINGTNVTTDNSILTNFSINAPLHMGQFTNNTFRLKGRLDEVALYNRPLTSSDVSILVNGDAAVLALSTGGGFAPTTGKGSEPGSSIGNGGGIILPPEITGVVSGQWLVLSWPATATGFTLESAEQLESLWAPVEGISIVVENGVSKVSLPLTTTNRFFRLRK